MEIFRDITEHTLGINHINAVNVIKLSHKREVFCNIPEHTQGINHFNVVNVTRPSHRREILKVIPEHTGDKPFQYGQCAKDSPKGRSFETYQNKQWG